MAWVARTPTASRGAGHPVCNSSEVRSISEQISAKRADPEAVVARTRALIGIANLDQRDDLARQAHAVGSLRDKRT